MVAIGRIRIRRARLYPWRDGLTRFLSLPICRGKRVAGA